MNDKIGLLKILQDEVHNCTKCEISKTKKNYVFARGNPSAKVIILGEAPGADEDSQGIPFVGRSGRLLDKMIASIDLDPEKDVYICNIIKCRPPDNRRPTPSEIKNCIGFLQAQLDIVKPTAIITLGNTATQSLLQTDVGISKLRGTWQEYNKIPVMPTYHPSFLLRNPSSTSGPKIEAWNDLLLVKKKLQSL